MASFAVQAIQNIIEHISERRMDQRRERMGEGASPGSATQLNGDDPENAPTKEESIDEMHSALVLRCHSPTPSQEQTEADEEVAIRASDLKALLEHSVALERLARRLLVAHLEEGSRAQILLRADWNLQSRDLRALESELKKGEKGGSNLGANSASKNHTSANGDGGKGLVATEAGISGHPEDREEREEEITETAIEGMDEEETLRAVRDFRRNVAGMLALGSRLRELEVRLSILFQNIPNFRL